ncbi:cupin domain-containing protein [Phenylobacterium sp.]|uniref:cupin domain-containing protein n=1 Tax=Phenylobacterium sp. TaxID=1871053 RepID=UPI00273062A2|nr:cupin domain-containing protein [Phenylobacterium sp.]MDP1872926.1 cupin domain-containing protein [Phenylobacterium sp.]MDP3489868.1 cupin domain-containing protein [Phenylobacterium sp.]
MRKLTLIGLLAATLPGLAFAAPSPPRAMDAVQTSPLSLALPQDDEPGQGDKVRMTVVQATLAPGESVPDNARTALRYIYVKSGRLQVSNLVTGDRQDVEAGEFAVEAAGQWHTGKAIGVEPVEILLIEQAPADL